MPVAAARIAGLTAAAGASVATAPVSAGVAASTTLVAVARYVADLAALVALGPARPTVSAAIRAAGCFVGAVTRDVTGFSAAVA